MCYNRISSSRQFEEASWKAVQAHSSSQLNLGLKFRLPVAFKTLCSLGLAVQVKMSLARKEKRLSRCFGAKSRILIPFASPSRRASYASPPRVMHHTYKKGEGEG